MTRTTPRSTTGFITLDQHLVSEGVKDAFEAIAVAEVRAEQAVFQGGPAQQPKRFRDIDR